MREHFLRLAKQSFVYGLSGVALQAVSLVTFPILAREFDPKTYGVLEVATAAFTVVLTLVDAGLTSAAQRSYYDYPEERGRSRATVVFTALAGTAVLSAVAAAIAIVFRDSLSEWLFRGESRPGLVTLIALTIPVANIAGFLRQVMRLRFRAWHFTISSILSTVVAAAVIVVGVVAFDLGVGGVFLGLLVGHACALVYGSVVVRDQLALRLSGQELRRMAAYGLPLVPAALALWALMLVDRLMLARLSALDDVGQYAAANRVVTVILLATTAFATAYGPYAFSLYSEDRELERRVRARTLTYLASGLTLGALVLTLFARELLAVLAPGFDQAYHAVGLVALGAVAYGLSTVVVAGISFARKTAWIAALTASAAVVNVSLNLVVIPPFGMIGAALATAVAFGLLTSAYYVVSQRLYPTPYEPGRALAVVAVGVAIGPLGLLTLDSGALETALKLAGLAAFLAALRALGVVRPGQLRSVVQGAFASRQAQA